MRAVSTPEPPALQRRLGTADAVTIGLGSMIGAGIFVALAPAASAAGTGLLAGLAVAAIVAYCNATSSARLAALYPQSGGTYVYGRERLGPFFGYLAGWGFVVGKTASCAAMALTVGAYLWPGRELVVAVLAVLALVVAACLTGSDTTVGDLGIGSGNGVIGILQAAGLLFFAFAGYARIATLGEEVKDPRRTISRAIPIALAITLVVYLLVSVAVLTALGPDAL